MPLLRIGLVTHTSNMGNVMINLKEWIEDSYWAWRNGFYFRFDSYEDDIDRGAFFADLNCGWYEMYGEM